MGFRLAARGGSEAAAKEFESKLLPVLDTGGRGATTTFAQRGLGDVLLTFENKVFLTSDRSAASATTLPETQSAR